MKRFILGAVIFLVAFLCTGKVSMAKENAVVDLGPPVTTTEEGVESSSGLADTSETDITAGLLPDVNTDSFFQRLYKKNSVDVNRNADDRGDCFDCTFLY